MVVCHLIMPIGWHRSLSNGCDRDPFEGGGVISLHFISWQADPEFPLTWKVMENLQKVMEFFEFSDVSQSIHKDGF